MFPGVAQSVEDDKINPPKITPNQYERDFKDELSREFLVIAMTMFSFI